MTPKEKAIELIKKMKFATDEFGYININTERHKQCALIAVDELIKETGSKYWYDVKRELENL
jgi:hypothetical protein